MACYIQKTSITTLRTPYNKESAHLNNLSDGLLVDGWNWSNYIPIPSPGPIVNTLIYFFDTDICQPRVAGIIDQHGHASWEERLGGLDNLEEWHPDKFKTWSLLTYHHALETYMLFFHIIYFKWSKPLFKKLNKQFVTIIKLISANGQRKTEITIIKIKHVSVTRNSEKSL